MNLRPKPFVNTLDFQPAQLEYLLQRAKELKGNRKERPLDGQAVALVFFNPSLRTRVSFEVAITQLGGQPVTMSVGSESWSLEHQEGVVMDGAKTEHVKDAARVLSRYVSAICVRAFPQMKSLEEDRLDPVIESFRKHAKVPVINMESSLWHPCQALADALTVQDRLGSIKGKRVSLVWTYHPKPLPMAVPNSFAAIMSQLGAKLTIAHPPEFPLDKLIVDGLPHKPEIVHDLAKGVEGTRVVYAKSWGSPFFYGKWEEEKELREKYRSWIVDRVPAEAFFMHCLPIRRNVEATDLVVDQSAVYDEAENRLHVQKAVLAELI